MARAADIANPELRQKVEAAFAAMRAGRGADAVRASAEAYLRFAELHPEVKTETVAMRGRQFPRMLRWPAMGANMKPDSVQAGAPQIEFLRDRFSVSEAMTYYQFVLDEILEKQGRGAGAA
ncbi:MAG TPA: hypothetical protein VMU93_13920 [Caulobacteraceae bacterium]|nr:hypothetical protein [Caulobacteraceae bacterium]